MKEFMEKLIGRLEEESKFAVSLLGGKTSSYIAGCCDTNKKTIKIVNELAEEHNGKTIIDGQYCWQTCGATEHCKECNRLCNGSIDYYENYDVLAEEYNNGWIPCEWELPNNCSRKYLVQKTNGNMDICGFTKNAYVLDKYDFAEYKGKKKSIFYTYDSEYGFIEWECEAWMPLPAPYKQKGIDK